MTTGNTVESFQQSVLTDCGINKIGTLINKVWSGQDWPKTVRRDPFVYGQSLQKIRRADGSVKWRKFVAPGHPPKRVSNEEHAYFSDTRVTHDTLCNWDNGLGSSGICSFEGAFGGLQSPSPSNVWTNNDTLATIAKLREAIAGSDFNAAVFLAEGNEALRMIAQNATKIYRMYQAIRKGQFLEATAVLGVSNRGRRRFHQPGNWSDNLLELQYGWRPLLGDVYGGAQFLAHQLNHPLTKTYRAGKRLQHPQSSFTWNTTAPTISRLQTYNAATGYRIKALISEVNVAQLSGLTDPASVLWELTPFSFVADWFIPIGSWLAARGLRSALTGTFVTSRLYEWHARGAVGVGTFTITGSGYRVDRFWTDRVISNNLDVPMPNFKPLAKAASWEHCLNAVALLTSIKGGDVYSFLKNR